MVCREGRVTSGRPLLCAIVIGVISSGCTVIQDLGRNVVEQFEYHDEAQARAIEARYRELAEEAWEQFEDTQPDEAFSEHYGRGFQQGFADYLGGGSGEPPPIPPRRYWTVSYQTPQGHQDILDWYAGYRQGAIAAEQSGYRYWVTIPTPLADRYGASMRAVPSNWLEKPPLDPSAADAGVLEGDSDRLEPFAQPYGQADWYADGVRAPIPAQNDRSEYQPPRSRH